jgi:hypothetical protein
MQHMNRAALVESSAYGMRLMHINMKILYTREGAGGGRERQQHGKANRNRPV